MEELELKLKELNQELVATNSIIEDIKQDIEELKKEDKSYIGAEITLDEYKAKAKVLEKKKSILNDAQDILQGIGI